MCECSNKNKSKVLYDSPIISIKIVSENIGALEILSINRNNKVVKNHMIINYCPMCR